MPDTVFFSWQSDRPGKINKSFLEGALKRAISDLGKPGDSLEAAERPVEFDKDTSGVAGSPPIVEVIFNKIKNCAVFVADVTFVGKSEGNRALQNPNVLIEYGWALSNVGDERIIAVMNTAYGKPDKNSMPFDLVHKRWPIQYCLYEKAEKADKDRARDALVKQLKDAISASLKTLAPPKTLPAPIAELPLLGHKSREISFLDNGDLVGITKPFGGHGQANKVYWRDGPQCFLRVFPESERPSLRNNELKELFQGIKPPLICPSIRSTWDEPNEFGYVNWECSGAEAETGTSVVTQVTSSGEIWGIDAKTLRHSGDAIPFPELTYAENLAAFISILRDQFKLKGPIGVQAGYSDIMGLAGYRPQLPPGNHHPYLSQKFGKAAKSGFVRDIRNVSLDPNDYPGIVLDETNFALPPFANDEKRISFEHAYQILIPFYEEYWDVLCEKRYNFLPRLVS